MFAILVSICSRFSYLSRLVFQYWRQFGRVSVLEVRLCARDLNSSSAKVAGNRDEILPSTMPLLLNCDSCSL